MKRLPILPIVILLVIAAMALWNAAPLCLVTLKTPVDFNTLTEEDIRSGVRVEGDVYAILDSFAVEESWTENSNGSVTPRETSKYYYIIPIGTESYAGLEISAKNYQAYAGVADATWDYLVGAADTIQAEPVHFEGYIAPMDEELYGLFVEWFQDTGYFGVTDAAAIEPYAVPYMLSTFSVSGVYIIMGVGAGALLIAVLLLTSHLRYRKKLRKAEENGAEPLSPTSPESVIKDLEQ